MKNFSALAIGLAGCLLASAAPAQNYRPFRPAFTYQLSEAATAGDTTYLLRLGAGQLQGGDSLFRFDRRTSRGRVNPAQGNCGAYVERPDNLFGATLRVRPGAEYVLAAANGRTFTLRPRQPLGQAWAATSSGLTAQVTARTLGTVLGQADSLAVITLSDGAVLTLSRRFGWVSGPALGRYLNPRLPAATLTLTALPELGLGTAQFGAFAVYDFQPGDVFLRKTTSSAPFGLSCGPTQQWTRDSILSRALSLNGDTLRYQVRSRTLVRSCTSAVAVLSPALVSTLRITRTTGQLDQPTGFWGTSAASGPAGRVHLPAFRTADYGGRPVQRHLAYEQCNAAAADTVSLRDMASRDFGLYISTAPGLGQTREEYISFMSDLTVLLGYRKGTETWGQLTTFAQLLPTRRGQPAAGTAAAPNPFGPELTVRLTLDRPRAVATELRDALGRVVLRRPAQPLGAGPRQLVLPTAGLPAGLYTLHLYRAGEGRPEVLKVVKAE
ncbi:hypothetical protein [Hymenobacter sp.]|uniref:hypothetical protein n=1 Tax=Hymenobacter sp. TaxID=1898978 RepID=UPI00286A5499|nr:hypothetical protein [Hymenobacter sp.]